MTAKTVNMVGAVYHGAFGVTLAADPNFYSPSGMSPLKYFEADAEGPVGEFAFRGFGTCPADATRILDSVRPAVADATCLAFHTPLEQAS